MRSSMTLTPAYGRDYKNQQQIRIDWESNKDFVVNDVDHPYCGKYCNKKDLIGQVKTVYIRYAKNTKVCKIEVR